MGNSNTSFLKTFHALKDSTPSPSNHDFWIPLFTSHVSTSELYAYTKPELIRTIIHQQPHSIHVLIFKAIEQLHIFLSSEQYWTGQLDSVRNSIGIIMRVMTIIFEEEQSTEDILNLLKNNVLPVVTYQPEPAQEDASSQPGSSAGASSAATTTTTAASTPSTTTPTDQAEQKIIPVVKYTVIEKVGAEPLNGRRLGEVLLDDLMKLLFLPHFSIPQKQVAHERQISQDHKKHYPSSLEANKLWQGGLAVPTNACWYTAQQKEMRVLILKCLLSLFSSSLYVDNTHFIQSENYFLDLAVRPDAPNTANLLYSLLNSMVNYNPTGFLPYTTTLMSDPEEDYVMTCLHVLGLLLFHSPQNEEGRNVYLEMMSTVGGLQEDLTKLHSSFQIILRNAIDANNTYLPASQKLFECHDEVIIIFWRFIEHNTLFRQYFLRKTDATQILEPLLFLLDASAKDETKFAFLQMDAFVLLLLSQHRDFCIQLNKPYYGKLPMSLPRFQGSYADLMLITIHKVITQDKGIMKSLFNVLLTSVSNISPYIKRLSVTASVKLLGLFEAFSKPRFLYAAPKHWELVDLLLRTFNNLIQYQYEGSVNLVYGILRRRAQFELLSRKPNIEAIQAVIDESAEKKNIARFHITPEWLSSWKPQLQLNTILLLIKGLTEEIEDLAKGGEATEDDLLTFLRNTTLVGLLPNPPMIVVKTFVSSPQIITFVNVFLYGLIYVRQVDPPLFSGRKIKLFKINFAEGVDKDEA